MDISFVIPAFNEAESIRELHREFTSVLVPLGRKYELIFVDDGSTDGTPSVLAEVTRADPNSRAIRLPENRGKAAAYMAGFLGAGGEYGATLDADLQDDPAELPKLLESLEAGADLAVGWRVGRARHEPFRTLTSRVYNRLKRLLFGLGIHDSNCGFRVMRRPVARGLVMQRGQHRLLPELAHLNGFRVAEARVAHRPRKHGSTKYGAFRFWTAFLDLLALRFRSSEWQTVGRGPRKSR